MPHADVNGQRLYYEDSGTDGPAIVFSHGFAMDHSMFDPQVGALGDRWRCVTWDERGHGQTRSTSDPFTYWDSADDVLGLLDHLSVESAVFAGMSQGGYLSLRAALMAPERARALVLIDTQPGVEDPEKVAGYDQLVGAWTEQGLPQEVADVVASIILGPGFPDTPAWQEKWRAMPADAVRRNYQTLVTREDDVQDRLDELDLPALVIHGEQDLAIGVEVARTLAEDLPRAELVVVPDSGHAANLTHPDVVNPALERFLEAL